jgi:hypothetical protein
MATGAFHAFLSSQTAEQLADLMTAVAEMMEQKKGQAEVVQPPKMTKAMTKVKGPAKRPLNSFMAFRAYYAPAFAKYQQKNISGFLNKLWAGDFVKAKWAILAKAYSSIRDRVGKENVPLDGFLALTCPVIGILPPEEYFEKMGWSFPAADKEPTRLFVAQATGFETTTLFSAGDIVKYCENQGYAIPVAGKSLLIPSSLIANFFFRL